MAIYCIQCGTSLPDDAVFCMKCGKQLKGGSAFPTTSSSSETELYKCEIKNLFKYDKYDNPVEQGKGTCTVTNRRLIFQTSKSGLVQIFLRDLDGIRPKAMWDIIGTTYIIWLDGYGYLWCKNKTDHTELASQIQKAMLQAK